MAAISLERLPGGRGGSFDTSGQRNHTITLRVMTDNKLDGSLTVGAYIANNGYPLGSAHPEDPLSFLQRIDPKSDAKVPTKWDATLSYSKRKRDSTDPADDPLEINFTNEKQQKPVWALNSAGDIFDPPPLRDTNIKLANIRLTIGSNIPAWVLSYEDAVNTDAYTIGGLAVPAFRSKCSSMEIGIEDDRDGNAMRVMQFSIQISRDDIRISAIDIGLRERDADGDLVNITNKDGSKISVPVPLLNGKKIEDPTPANTQFRLIDESLGGYVELPFKNILPGCL